MGELTKLLLEEQKKLQDVIAITSKRLATAPPGSLRVGYKNKCAQFYHVNSNEDLKNSDIIPKMKYIAKKDRKFIAQLAQKHYDQKIIKIAKKREYHVNNLIANFKADSFENVYQREHLERQKLIDPVELPWEVQLEKWLEEAYQGKKISDDIPEIITEKGERVRSKSEKIIADYLYRNNIPYKYEKPLILKGYGTVYPDFTILSKKTRKEIYWEHEGMMDNPEYAGSAVKKIHSYQANGIFPGNSLILTFETAKTILSTREMEEIVRQYIN